MPGEAYGYSRLRGSGQRCLPPRPGLQQEATSPVAVACAVPGHRGCRSSGPGRGWPAWARPHLPACLSSEGSWEPGLLGRRAGRWWPRSWGVQRHCLDALDPAPCAPCEPCGKQSQEVPPPGRPLGRTDEKQANGRTAVHPRACPPGYLSQQPCPQSSSAAGAAGPLLEGLPSHKPLWTGSRKQGSLPSLVLPGTSQGLWPVPVWTAMCWVWREGLSLKALLSPFCGQGVCCPHSWPPPRPSRPCSCSDSAPAAPTRMCLLAPRLGTPSLVGWFPGTWARPPGLVTTGQAA